MVAVCKIFFWIRSEDFVGEPRRNPFVESEAEVRGIAVTPPRHQFLKSEKRS
jgi:hypothetical protein